MVTHWHAALCWGGQEMKAFRRLVDNNWPVFLPRWVQDRRLYNRIVPTMRPLHSGCIFISFDGNSPAEWHATRACFGDLFGRFIGGEFPTVIRDSAFDSLRELYNADATGLMPIEPRVKKEELQFAPGDMVRVLGALSVTGEVVGRITWADRIGARFVYTFLGREIEGYAPHDVKMFEKIQQNQSISRIRRGSRHGIKKGVYA